tara:strand:- start:816 stop:1091 length:276 start_codon:yes stop_codon:yes gene_type:complete
MTNIQNIIASILALDSDDELAQVYDAFKVRRRQLGDKKKNGFTVGDRVKFRSRRDNSWVCGEVSKLMIKNIGVRTDDGLNWRVAPAFLEAE